MGLQKRNSYLMQGKVAFIFQAGYFFLYGLSLQWNVEKHFQVNYVDIF